MPRYRPYASSASSSASLRSSAVESAQARGRKPKAAETAGKYVDQGSGIGAIVKNDGDISSVIWDSAAFKAGLVVGAKILAVNGNEFSPEDWKAAITAAKDGKTPIQIIVKQDKYYRTLSLAYSGGLRYPRLEKTGEGEGSLDRLLKPRT